MNPTDSFEISDPRWVHTAIGWNWLACVRFQDHGQRRSYAFFFNKDEIVDQRYAVQIDACGTQTYSPFNLLSPKPSENLPAKLPENLGPIY